MKFRKKPVEIEAVEFVKGMAEGRDPLPDGVEFVSRSTSPVGELVNHRHVIRTLEGPMQVSIGDWVITGVKGERYPCKPDIFAMTYEAV